MLQQRRLFTQWRLGLWVKESSICSSSGRSATVQSHLRKVHHKCNSLLNYRTSVCRRILLDSNGLTSTQISRFCSSQGKQPSFLSNFIDNLKQELAKNKEMKENLRKFREEAEKLEQSDALKKARAKYISVENEASALKARFEKVKDTVSGVIEEASKSEIAKKAGKISEELSKSAKDAAETLSVKGQKLGASETFKTISEATNAVREEFEPSTSQSRVYMAPMKLRKRLETPDVDERIYAPDEKTMDVELHKDSRLYESWQNFKNNNRYMNKILDWKMKVEESENSMVRVSRIFKDKISDLMGGIFPNTELSAVMTEIVKVDPTFSKANFLRQCETDIIPNILEAMTRGDLEILKDWCHEGPFNLLSTPILQAKQIGAKIDAKVLDIENVDVLTGSIMDPGPVLIISFNAQQTQCVRDKKGKVLEGDPEKVMNFNYTWALSRDRNILDPKAAWRLLDINLSISERSF